MYFHSRLYLSIRMNSRICIVSETSSKDSNPRSLSIPSHLGVHSSSGLVLPRPSNHWLPQLVARVWPSGSMPDVRTTCPGDQWYPLVASGERKELGRSRSCNCLKKTFKKNCILLQWSLWYLCGCCTLFRFEWDQKDMKRKHLNLENVVENEGS